MVADVIELRRLWKPGPRRGYVCVRQADATRWVVDWTNRARGTSGVEEMPTRGSAVHYALELATVEGFDLFAQGEAWSR